MKMVKMSVMAAAIALSTSAAQAYYIDGAYVGTAAVSLSGACSFKKQTYTDAQFGSIYDENDGDSYVGWGLLTSENQLIAVYQQESYSYILYKWTASSWNGVGTYYEDYLSEPLVSIINSYAKDKNNAECDIENIFPNAKSRIVYKDDYDPGYANYKGSVSLKFAFDGFVDETYAEDAKGYSYKGGAFSGKVTFKGKTVPPIF